MAQANPGDTVSIHYTGRLDDGTVFDTSQDRDPLQFTLGEKGIIQGLQDAIQGMAEGESKTAKLPPEQAYGERRDDLVVTVPPDQFPDDIEPAVGQQLQMGTSTGQTVPVLITDVKEDGVELDANHPLAGRHLTFDIELVEIG